MKKLLLCSLCLCLIVILGVCLDGFYKVHSFEQQKEASFASFIANCSDLGVFDNKNDYQTNKNWLFMAVHNSFKSENPTCLNHFCFFRSTLSDKKYDICRKLADNAQDYWDVTQPYIGKPVDRAVNIATWTSFVVPFGEAIAALGIGAKSYQLYRASKLANSSKLATQENRLRMLPAGRVRGGTAANTEGAAVSERKMLRPTLAKTGSSALGKKELLQRSISVVVLGGAVLAGIKLFTLAKAALVFLSTHKIISLTILAAFILLLIAARKMVRRLRRKNRKEERF